MTDEKPTMMTYIKATPEQLATNTRDAHDITRSLVDAYVSGGYERVVIVACGSSANGSQCALPLMIKYLRQDVQVVPPETFNCCKHALGKTDFVFAVSQSGCSTNTIAALDRLREMGRLSIGLTGNAGADFKEHADLLVDWCVGTENVGYVTKGVTTLAQFLMLFALGASQAKGLTSDRDYAAVMAEMAQVSERHEVVQRETNEFYERNRAALTSLGAVYSCGFAQGYGVACESALKIGETIKVPSFAYEAEEYIHGPHLQLTPKYTAFFYDDLGVCGERLHTIYRATRTVTDYAYAVTNSPEVDDTHAVRLPFEIGEPLLAPLYVLPFCQTIAFRASTELNSWDSHPLLSQFGDIAATKTKSISQVMPY